MSETGNIANSDLKELFQIFSPYSAVHREDLPTVMKTFDLDKDGKLSIEDFKRMSLV